MKPVPKIYLVNVGANTADRKTARSPLFSDDNSFAFVSFSAPWCRTKYPKEAHRYISDPVRLRTHADPDWKNLTYGDNCNNPKARALLNAGDGDILLFWALLWQVADRRAEVWKTEEKRWCLIGALKVEARLESGQDIDHLSATQTRRVLQNEHIKGKRVDRRPLTRIFLGDPAFSAKFDGATDLGIYSKHSLLRRTVRTADGRRIQWNERPRWNSATRACRAILDLEDAGELRRAKMIRDRIRESNPKFNLLAGLKD
jgi:hypothetical protein